MLESPALVLLPRHANNVKNIINYIKSNQSKVSSSIVDDDK